MSKYTIELRALVETFGTEVLKWFSAYELSDYLTPTQIAAINSAGIWTKEKLAKKIVNHYEMREIGLETPGYFAKRAKVFMAEIMEEKLPLIYAKTLIINPINDVQLTESFTGSGDATSDSTSKNTGSGLTIESNTPQGRINKQAILNGDFASSTSANEGDSENITTGNSKNSNEYTKTISGNQKKSQIEMLQEYQRNVMAIDKEIIDRASSLFMNIY